MATQGFIPAMVRVTSPASPGEIMQQPGGALGGGWRRNAQRHTIAHGHIGGSKSGRSLSSSSTSSDGGGTEPGLLFWVPWLYHTGIFSLISLKMPGLLRTWPGWCLEGLKKGPGITPAPRAWGSSFPKHSQRELLGSFPGTTPANGVCQKELTLQGTREVSMHQGRWAQPRGFGCGVSAFAPETVGESRGGFAIIRIPRAGELKARDFLPSPPTRASGAKYISHCTQRKGGGEAMWEGTVGAGKAVGRREQIPQEHGTSREPVFTPAAARVENGLSRSFTSSYHTEAMRGAAQTPQCPLL